MSIDRKDVEVEVIPVEPESLSHAEFIYRVRDTHSSWRLLKSGTAQSAGKFAPSISTGGCGGVFVRIASEIRELPVT